VCQLHLRLVVPPLALAGFLLRTLALGQIDHERHALVAALAEGHRAHQDGNAAAVLAEVLLLERLDGSRRFISAKARSSPARHSPGVQLRPTDPAGGEILAVVSHHAEEGVVGLEEAAVQVPEADPDDVGVDQAPDLRFPLLEVAVEAGVLQRDGRLRRQHSRSAVRSGVKTWEVSVFSR